jgi:hypothetical protein
MTMAKRYRGTVKRNDLEGGFWQLHTAEGERYTLEGGGPDLLSEGAEAEVEGKVDKGAMGFAMSGPILKVVSYSLKK